jgi:methyl-accepting chemotaxis protein
VSACSEYATAVDGAFGRIRENNEQVRNRAKNMKADMDGLDRLMTDAMENVDNIGTSIHSSSEAMEEISASISNLDSNIRGVVEGYNDINRITDELKHTRA